MLFRRIQRGVWQANGTVPVNTYRSCVIKQHAVQTILFIVILNQISIVHVHEQWCALMNYAKHYFLFSHITLGQIYSESDNTYQALYWNLNYSTILTKCSFLVMKPNFVRNFYCDTMKSSRLIGRLWYTVISAMFCKK